MLRNGEGRIGTGTRLLHWTMAAGVLATLPIGLRIANGEPSLALIPWFGVHKTIGLTLLALAVLRIAWHRITPPPPPLPGEPPWADRLARATHRAFYVLLLLVPLAGWVASSASGIDTVIFGAFTVPAVAPVSPEIERAAFLVHRVGAYALAALVVLHIAGALKRAIAGDGTLRRMVTGRSHPG
jgi:cytochrome b561